MNLVLFSGSNKPNFFNEIKVELEKIGSNVDAKKFNIWYGGGKEGLMSVLPLRFYHSGGFVGTIDWKYFIERYGSIPFFNNIITETFWERQKICEIKYAGVPIPENQICLNEGNK